MSHARRFPASGYVYIGVVGMCGAAALTDAGRSLLLAPPGAGWLALACLTWLSGAFAIKIPSISATISVSEVFVFTLAILFGGPAAIVTVAVDGLLSSIYRGNRQPRRLLFNVAEPAMSASVACYLYYSAGSLPPLSVAPAPLSALVWPLFVLAISYLLMNTWLTAAAMAFESGASALAIWRKHIPWLSVNFTAGASIALLLAVNMREVSLQGIVLILPLVFVLYLVFRTWTERVREADTHVARVNRLYLSTVEALAIAIESKDRVTHGHVRRVQTLSLAVASRLGVTDSLDLRAIESGALLHDIGKVAIPDHLLNKPGKLTPDEYELVKLHAPIGAEILKAVEFPYPVVPIVRHHHESWDGTGYPDRIAGEAIPIGARIVSVVDCFDALTSHRPYRRALSDEDALDVIRARRGTMYDPAVVDALGSCYSPFRSGLQPHDDPRDVSLLIARANQVGTEATPEGDVRAAAPTAMGASSSSAHGAEPAWQVAAQMFDCEAHIAIPAAAALLRALTPATTVCLGLVNRARQSVRIVHAFGHGEQLLQDRSVRIGEGVTGWVAAHGTGISNSDPALDFPEQVEILAPRIRTALAVPIGSTGVLTLYSTGQTGFSHADRTVAEQTAERLEALLTEAADPKSTPATLETSLPGALWLGAEVAALLPASVPAGRSCGILSISLPASSANRTVDETVLATLVLPAIRLNDGLFATSRDEIVAVLPGCEPEAERLIRSRLQEALDETCDPIGGLLVGFAVIPHDGVSVSAALRTARSRRQTLRRRGVAGPRDESAAVGIGKQP